MILALLPVDPAAFLARRAVHCLTTLRMHHDRPAIGPITPPVRLVWLTDLDQFAAPIAPADLARGFHGLFVKCVTHSVTLSAFVVVVVVMSAMPCHCAPALVVGMARPSSVPICSDIAAVQ
jgi:hypothetical protein